MASTGCVLTGDWKKLEMALDPAVNKPILEKHVRKATTANGHLAARKIREVMREGKFEPNAPLTVDIKRSRKPLVDRGDLWKAVTSSLMSWEQVFVGIKYQMPHPKAGVPAFKLALTLHDGDTIEVTQAMRGMFAALQAAAEGQIDPANLTGRAAELWERRPTADWHGLSPTTTHIVIPGRPFLKVALSDPGLHDAIKAQWEEALKAAFKELAAKGGS